MVLDVDVRVVDRDGKEVDLVRAGEELTMIRRYSDGREFVLNKYARALESPLDAIFAGRKQLVEFRFQYDERSR